jgi:PAS domain-containing protein
LLFDGNPIPTALCDPQSYGFLAVNDAAAALWGYPREALLAMSLYDVALNEDWTRCAAAPGRRLWPR